MKINSWNKDVFKKQLSLNLKELSGDHPLHWITFLNFIRDNKLENSKILDVGCGVGAYYKLCKDNFPHLSYKGIDFSDEAVFIARTQWEEDVFEVKNYKDLTQEYAESFDVLLFSALLDNLENADEAFKFLLSLGFSFIIASRLSITNQPSYRTEYNAYGEKYTSFHHNYNKLQQEIVDANYSIIDKKIFNMNMCVLLNKK